ncbi:MAG: DUF3857 domain-containing protein, partial [Bacteroidetes bacterium]|nr:DUF3857 domain-containing protein [Bacteroidota bacterium]
MRSFLLLALVAACCQTFARPEVRLSEAPAWLFKNAPLSKKAPAANAISSGYYLALADQQTNLFTNTSYTHIIRHIVNTSGVQNASEVSVSFSPSYQQVEFHKVVIIRGGKTINQLSQNNIKVVGDESESEAFEYTGLKRAFIILEDVQKGDEVEFAYSVTGFNPVFANKYSDNLLFCNSNPIANYFITIIAPASRKLNLRSFNNAPAPQETLQGNTRIYHWDNPTIADFSSGDDTPSWYNENPYTSVTEFNSWTDVADWGVKLFNHYRFPLPAALQTQIAAWRRKARGDKFVFAELATRFVQDQVRYLALEMGTHTHQPHAPADVFNHRFGDCKDKALLLATILQQDSIPAYVALVNTTIRSKLRELAPSAGCFDHAIVAVGSSTGYLYIDATASLQRGAFASRYMPDYGYALILRE